MIPQTNWCFQASSFVSEVWFHTVPCTQKWLRSRQRRFRSRQNVFFTVIIWAVVKQSQGCFTTREKLQIYSWAWFEKQMPFVFPSLLRAHSTHRANTSCRETAGERGKVEDKLCKLRLPPLSVHTSGNYILQLFTENKWGTNFSSFLPLYFVIFPRLRFMSILTLARLGLPRPRYSVLVFTRWR